MVTVDEAIVQAMTRMRERRAVFSICVTHMDGHLLHFNAPNRSLMGGIPHWSTTLKDGETITFTYGYKIDVNGIGLSIEIAHLCHPETPCIYKPGPEGDYNREHNTVVLVTEEGTVVAKETAAAPGPYLSFRGDQETFPRVLNKVVQEVRACPRVEYFALYSVKGIRAPEGLRDIESKCPEGSFEVHQYPIE